MTENTVEHTEDSEPRFEELLEVLENVVERLEGGELSLETALDAFEKGMGLVERARAILDQAEARVEELLEARDGGISETPFEP